MTTDESQALIIEIGEQLYGAGEGWQAQMARDLGVNRSTVQDWRQGRCVPRRGVWADLLAVARNRATHISSAIGTLRGMVGD